MLRKLGKNVVSLAPRAARWGGVGTAAAILAAPAFAFTAPAATDLGFDVYDFVVNQGVKGPMGFVAGVAAFLFGVSKLFSNVMVGIPTIVAAVCLIRADTILQTFGMTV